MAASPVNQPRLTVENGPQQGSELALSRDQSYRIGAADDCDLQLSSPGIADHHLVIKALRDEGFGAKCLDNPFILNGRSSEAARLSDGDVLELGSVRVRYSTGATARATRSAPKNLGGFRLHKVLGAGGMGTVYEAEQVSLNREVALKVLSKDLTKDPVFVARFVAEARAAARLHHPNVVQVFDVDHDGDTFYYSMERMQGSVEDRLKELGKLDVKESLEVIADAARGLSFAESLRIVHRDIKPDNLMRDQHGMVKIADLGLAMTDEDNVSKVVGTPHFMSPEQALGKPLDHRSDLYSLGCTFYRLLTGGTPFRKSTVKEILKAHVKEPPESPSKIVPEVPAEVSLIVEKLLAKNPDERYQSAGELLEEIESVLHPPVRKGLIITLAAVAVLAGGGAIAWGLTRKDGQDRVVKETVRDLTTEEALRAELRERDGEVAHLRAMLDHPEGPKRAAALEAVARDFSGTEAGLASQEAATALRTELRRVAAEQAARQQAVSLAVTELREQADRALKNDDYRALLDAVRGDAIAADLRDAPAIEKVRGELRANAEQVAQTRLASFQTAFDSAFESGDTGAAGDALQGLERLTDAEKGWPAELWPEGTDVANLVTSTRQRLTDLQESVANAATREAWQRYLDGMFGETGVLAAADRFDFTRAANQADQLAGALGDFEAGAHAAALAESLRQAQSFQTRFVQAAETGEMTYTMATADDQTEPEIGTVVGFETGGPQPGLKVKVGPTIRPRIETIGFDQIRGTSLDQVFRLPDGASPPQRGAFLAWITIADQIANARAYMSEVVPEPPPTADPVGEPASNPGGDAIEREAEPKPIYPGSLRALRSADGSLRHVDQPWAAATQHEVFCAKLMVRAMLALSSERAMSAANHLDELLVTGPNSLVVAGTRK